MMNDACKLGVHERGYVVVTAAWKTNWMTLVQAFLFEILKQKIQNHLKISTYCVFKTIGNTDFKTSLKM